MYIYIYTYCTCMCTWYIYIYIHISRFNSIQTNKAPWLNLVDHSQVLDLQDGYANNYHASQNLVSFNTTYYDHDMLTFQTSILMYIKQWFLSRVPLQTISDIPPPLLPLASCGLAGCLARHMPSLDDHLGMALRKVQHTPGTYPKPSTTLWVKAILA